MLCNLPDAFQMDRALSILIVNSKHSLLITTNDLFWYASRWATLPSIPFIVSRQLFVHHAFSESIYLSYYICRAILSFVDVFANWSIVTVFRDCGDDALLLVSYATHMWSGHVSICQMKFDFTFAGTMQRCIIWLVRTNRWNAH